MTKLKVIVEYLSNGKVRATARDDGRTLEWFDGEKEEEGIIFMRALRVAGRGHDVGGEYDMTYIGLNEAARTIYDRLNAVRS